MSLNQEPKDGVDTVLSLLVFALLLTMVLSLFGCAAPGPARVEVRTELVPVPVSCVPADAAAPPPQASLTREQVHNAPDAAAQYQLLADYWAAVSPFLAQEVALVTACHSAAAPATR